MEPVPTLDYRVTSRRPALEELPAAVRAAVETAAGGTVATAGRPVSSGFSGGFAAVLCLADGRDVFAKAGSGANPHLVQAYAREAEVLAALPLAVPAPRLVGAGEVTAEDGGGQPWRVVVTEAASGAIPLPWTERSFAAVHDACVAAAAALDPAPAALAPGLGTVTGDYAVDAEILAVFPDLAAGRTSPAAGQPPWLTARAGDLEELVATAERVLQGTTATHGDLRADNVLVDGDRAVLVDWNFLALGPPWLDLAGLLPAARADGVDADAWVRRSPLLRDVDPVDVDVWLAVLAAYMLANVGKPLWPGAPPALRVHQRRYARLFLDWLGDRRGWAP